MITYLFACSCAIVRLHSKQVCEKIVIPNLQLREEDEEMFELDWVEYVRRDAEGSDSDTRRRAATDLVKALTEKFQPEVWA